jgi:hypothetical protein
LKTSIAFWKSLKFNHALYTALVIVCFNLPTSETHAQADSLRTLQQKSAIDNIDTVSVKRLDPRKALFYSAVFPGLGQIYNGKYWKLPFVYGGFVVTVLVVDFYQDAYVKYRDELYIYLATGTSPSNRSESNLRYIVDKARRQRDYWIIWTGVWYLLQIVDAHVDAHLQEFNVNKDMRISLEPTMKQNYLTGRTTGFSLTLKF